jgi:Ca2+-binding EF-hand superfamily protein
MSSHSPEELQEIFDKYDRDHSGFIDTWDLRQICDLLSVNVGSPEFESVVVNAEEKRGGRVSFDDFCKILTP